MDNLSTNKISNSALPGGVIPLLAADADPQETSEWLEALDYVLSAQGVDRAAYLLTRLKHHAFARNVSFTGVATTPVTIFAMPITNLNAQSSSPTELGSLTFFTATASGIAVTYHWDFGDGTTGSSGSTLSHQYNAIGAYTATVTATNSISTVVATTLVTITARPIAGLSASNSGPTPIGKPTTLTATIEAGDPVTFTWNFSDGSPSAIGRVVTHTYPFTAQFSFTATVVASNPVNTQTAATLVTIVPHRLSLPLLLKSN